MLRNEKPEQKSPSKLVRFYLIVLTSAFVLFSLYFFWKHIASPIYDFHGFRQSQTALAARNISDWESFFNYETPVLGPPWSIPFEFPTFQILAKKISDISSVPLEISGRLISVVFFFLSGFIGVRILTLLNATTVQKTLFFLFFVSSPMYLFWSRTFMIESTALCFSMLLMYSFLNLRNKYSSTWMFLAILWGVLAAVTKITTFLPLCLCITLIALYEASKSRPIDIRKLLRLALIILIPIGIFLIWNAHADALKNINPIAQGYLDSDSLKKWNFGTLKQRIQVTTWTVLLERANNVCSVIILALATLWICLRRTKPSLYIYVLIFVLSFISPFLIFTNLYYKHQYYPYANGIFALIALALVVGEWVSTARPFAAVLLVASILSLQVFEFNKTGMIWANIENKRIVAVGRFIEETTAPDSVIICHGLDWSPELSYESKRRAIMLIPQMKNFQVKYEKSLEEIRKRSYSLSAYIDCATPKRPDLVPLEFQGKKKIAYTYEDCEVYTW